MIYTSAINVLLNRRDNHSAEAVRAVAREMESLFIYELLKTMRRTTMLSGQNRGLQADFYTALIDLQLARSLSEKGIGLQELLFKELKRIAGDNDSSSDRTMPFRRLPVEGTISSPFGWRRHPVTGERSFHKGIDIAAPAGTEVRAVKDGTVVFSGAVSGYGNMVVIDHGDGFVTRYAHNEKNLVRSGQKVREGQRIAIVGGSGTSTGPHVHFEVICEGNHVDPENYLYTGRG